MHESFDHKHSFRPAVKEAPQAGGIFYAAFIICVLISIGLKLLGLSH